MADSNVTVADTLKAAFNYKDSITGEFNTYHWETETDQIVDFEDKVAEVVNDKFERVNLAGALQLPTTDSGLINAIWIDTES